MNSFESGAPVSSKSSLSSTHPFVDSDPLRRTTTKAPLRVSFKIRRTSSHFKCPFQVLQVIMAPATVFLSLRPLFFEDFNPPLEIFNLPIGLRFLLFEGLNSPFSLPQFFILMENRLLSLLKSLLCKVEFLGQLSIIPLWILQSILQQVDLLFLYHQSIVVGTNEARQTLIHMYKGPQSISGSFFPSLFVEKQFFDWW